jgi:hypothetical protein
MRVAWYDNNKLQEESKWETKDEAEQALLLLTKYAIGGEMEACHGMRVIQVADA